MFRFFKKYEKKNLLVKMNNGKFREILNRKSKLKIAMAVTKYIKEGEVRSGGGLESDGKVILFCRI